MSSIDLDVSQAIYGIERSHYHCTLENFEWESEEKKEKTLDFLIQLQDRVNGNLDTGQPPPHMLCMGPPGNGKTHLSVAIYRWAVLRSNARLCHWLNVPKFCDEVKNSYDGSVLDPFDEVNDARTLLVLDDLLGRDLSAYESGTIVNRLIDTAYRNGAGLIVTTNYKLQELADRFHQHELSRILENCTVLNFKGEDRRL
jgi:DNA replication protein DnaC